MSCRRMSIMSVRSRSLSTFAWSKNRSLTVSASRVRAATVLSRARLRSCSTVFTLRASTNPNLHGGCEKLASSWLMPYLAKETVNKHLGGHHINASDPCGSGGGSCCRETAPAMARRHQAEVWGHPAGLAVAKNGSRLIADDVSQSIWRVAIRADFPGLSLPATCLNDLLSASPSGW